MTPPSNYKLRLPLLVLFFILLNLSYFYYLGNNKDPINCPTPHPSTPQINQLEEKEEGNKEEENKEEEKKDEKSNTTLLLNNSNPIPQNIVITKLAFYKLYAGHPVFEPVQDVLGEVFTILGIPHQRVRQIDYDDKDSIYITNAVHHGDLTMPQRYIAWNLEQLTTDKNWPAFLWERYKKAEEMWDYSLENIKVHNSRGIHALHVPYAYSPCLSYFHIMYDKTIAKDVDMLHLGYLSERRNRIISMIPNREKTVINGDYYNENYGKICRRTKVGLNCHFFGGKTILEIHRILPMVANNLLVMSQRSDDKWLDDKFAPIVEYFDESNLLEIYNKILNMDAEAYQKKAQSNLQYLQKEYNMITLFLKSNSSVVDIIHR